MATNIVKASFYLFSLEQKCSKCNHFHLNIRQHRETKKVLCCCTGDCEGEHPFPTAEVVAQSAVDTISDTHRRIGLLVDMQGRLENAWDGSKSEMAARLVDRIPAFKKDAQKLNQQTLSPYQEAICYLEWICAKLVEEDWDLSPKETKEKG